MRSWLITGSVATKHWFPKYRNPLDIDILVDREMSKDSSPFPAEIHWNPMVEDIIAVNEDPVYVDANMLYTIKVSHAAWDVKWSKTMADIDFLKREDCYIEHNDIFDGLVSHWATVHGKKRVQMNVDNDKFFKDAVNRKIDHDELHVLVAKGTPMHTQIRKDPNSPLCSKELWDELPHHLKIQTAIEEICVIAIERYFTNTRTSSIMVAIHKAHKNLVTSMTSGWFNRFLIENARELLVDEKIWCFDTVTRVAKTLNLKETK